MAEIVNLRQARKRRAKGDKDARAAGNRAKFGQTKAKKLSDAQQQAKSARELDGKKLDQINLPHGPAKKP